MDLIRHIFYFKPVLISFKDRTGFIKAGTYFLCNPRTDFRNTHSPEYLSLRKKINAF
jgi:hypothetical protein